MVSGGRAPRRATFRVFPHSGLGASGPLRNGRTTTPKGPRHPPNLGAQRGKQHVSPDASPQHGLDMPPTWPSCATHPWEQPSHSVSPMGPYLNPKLVLHINILFTPLYPHHPLLRPKDLRFAVLQTWPANRDKNATRFVPSSIVPRKTAHNGRIRARGSSNFEDTWREHGVSATRFWQHSRSALVAAIFVRPFRAHVGAIWPMLSPCVSPKSRTCAENAFFIHPL